MKTSLRLPFCIALFVLGCNDSKHVHSPDDAPMPSTESETADKSAASDASNRASAAGANDPGSETDDSSDDSGFDAEFARRVIERGRKQAVQCPNVAKDTPVGEGEIEILFDGQSGKVFEVNLGTTFSAGSADAQACLKNAFLGQIVTPFKGTKKVPYTLNVPAAAAPDKGSEGPKGPKKP